jgi:hypothetical protein
LFTTKNQRAKIIEIEVISSNLSLKLFIHSTKKNYLT